MSKRIAWSAAWGVFGLASVAVAIPLWQAAAAAHSDTSAWWAIAVTLFAAVSFYSVAAVLASLWPYQHLERDPPDGVEIGRPEPGIGTRRVPVPPEPHYPHPFAVHAHAGWRAAEKAMLTEWLSGSGGALLVLVSLGGMGKSTLAWTWMQAFVARGQSAPAGPAKSHASSKPNRRGAMWWSFHDRDGSFEHFVSEALAYTDGDGARRDRMPPPADSVVELLNNLRSRPFLLVLDGFERQLVAHAPLAEPEDDPSAAELPERARRCAAPVAAKFLRDFQAVPGASRILLTTTLYPSDLDDLAGTRREDLGPLPLSDSVDFLETQGVRGPSAELAGICKEYDCHPLSLRVLSKVVVEDPLTPGAVSVLRRGELRDAALAHPTDRALSLAYRSLPDMAQVLLGRLATFHFPIAPRAALAVSPCDSASEFADMLGVLRRRELVSLQDGHYNVHPLVRSYAYHRLPSAAKRDTHEMAVSYLLQADGSAAELRRTGITDTVDGVLPHLELFYQRLGAQDWDGVLKMLDDLRQQLYYRLGAYTSYAQAVSALVNEETLDVYGGRAAFQQAWVLNLFGNARCAIGRPTDAISAFLRARDLEPEGSLNAPTDAGNLGARCFLPLGRLKEAETQIMQRVQLSQTLCEQLSAAAQTEEVVWDIEFTRRTNEPIGHSDLGYLYGLRGDERASEIAFANARALFQDDQSLGMVERLRGDVAVLRGDVALARQCAATAEKLTAVEELPRDVIHLRCLQAAVRNALAEQAPAGSDGRGAHLQHAEVYLDEAWTQCGRTGLIEAEAKLHIARGHWERLCGRPAEAKGTFQRAVEVAAMCGYRINEADAQHGLAQIAYEQRDFEVARSHTMQAFALAECDSGEYRYELGVARIQHLVNQLP